MTMDENKKDINSFLNILQATFLTVFILTVYSLVTISRNQPIRFSSLFSAFVIGTLFYFSIASFIFSAIFQYINKRFPTFLYILLFFFCLWALIFILSYSAERKCDNQIPDIMDGVSESITLFLIKIGFISIVSNFIIILKNCYFIEKENTFTDSKF